MGEPRGVLYDAPLVRAGLDVTNNMDWKLFATVFSTVFLAEIGDKTQLATMLFASDARHGKATVLLASMAALCVAAAIGVLAGTYVGKFVSPQTLRWIAGVGFIAIGVWTLARPGEAG